MSPQWGSYQTPRGKSVTILSYILALLFNIVWWTLYYASPPLFHPLLLSFILSLPSPFLPALLSFLCSLSLPSSFLLLPFLALSSCFPSLQPHQSIAHCSHDSCYDASFYTDTESEGEGSSDEDSLSPSTLHTHPLPHTTPKGNNIDAVQRRESWLWWLWKCNIL